MFPAYFFNPRQKYPTKLEEPAKNNCTIFLFHQDETVDHI